MPQEPCPKFVNSWAQTCRVYGSWRSRSVRELDMGPHRWPRRSTERQKLLPASLSDHSCDSLSVVQLSWSKAPPTEQQQMQKQWTVDRFPEHGCPGFGNAMTTTCTGKSKKSFLMLIKENCVIQMSNLSSWPLTQTRRNLGKLTRQQSRQDRNEGSTLRESKIYWNIPGISLQNRDPIYFHFRGGDATSQKEEDL